MTLNERLGYYRKASGVSQMEAAEKLDVARQTIGRWEQGVSSPTMEHLLKMSELYGTPIDAFLKDDWTPPEETKPEIQFVEVPVEVPVPQPVRWRLAALLAALILAAGISIGALFVWEQPKKIVPSSELESEVISDAPSISTRLLPLD